MLKRVDFKRAIGDELEDIVCSGDYHYIPLQESRIEEAVEKAKAFLRHNKYETKED